jgi:hypothetical protein
MATFQPCDLEQPQHFVDAVSSLLLRKRSQAKANILRDGQMRKERVVLKQKADVAIVV